MLLHDGDAIVGFALAHTAPLVEGRTREELRVLKLVLEDETRFEELVHGIAILLGGAGHAGSPCGFKVSSSRAYRRMIALGGHMRWTDLRMSLSGYEEKRPQPRARAVQLGDLTPCRGSRPCRMDATA